MSWYRIDEIKNWQLKSPWSSYGKDDGRKRPFDVASTLAFNHVAAAAVMLYLQLGLAALRDNGLAANFLPAYEANDKAAQCTTVGK